jgi:ferric-dicitrate binding protein FerR (iron transport regulator)
MAKYRATLHLSGLSGDSPQAVQSALDALLKKRGLENCRIVRIDPEGLATRAAPARAAERSESSAWRRQANAGGLLLVAAAAWAIWFFWWMFSVGTD